MGGAIYNNGGTVSIMNSTFSGNSAVGGSSIGISGAGLGGAIFSRNGYLTILQSTISGNVLQVLIVQTQPGYGPAPGHQGFGRVVAVVCSTP